MAKSFAEIDVRIGADIEGLQRGLRAAQRAIRGAAADMTSMGNSLSVAITAPMAAFGVAAIRAAGEAESMRKALETTMQDAGYAITAATGELEKLREAAKAPGLDFQQAVKGSVRLQNVGFSAEKSRKILVELANAIAMSGGSAQELDGVTRQFGQMIAKGRVLQEDLTIIQENMPAISKAMEAAFGTKSAEKIRDLGITAEQFVDGVTEQLAKLPRVQGGITNSIVNAWNAVQKALATAGETINRVFNVSGRLEAFGDWVVGLSDRFSRMSEGAQRAVAGIGFFALALGPAIRLGGLFVQVGGAIYTAMTALQIAALRIESVGLVGWFSRLNLAMRVNVIGVTAAAVLALMTAFGALGSSTQEATYAQRTFHEAQKAVIAEAAKESAAMETNIETLRNASSSTLQRKMAIEALKGTYPEYLRGMDLERASVADLDALQKRLNVSILQGVAARRKAQTVEAELEKAVSAQLRIEQLRKGGFGALSGGEVKQAGRSLFGTEFEKGFVSAAAQGQVVADVIKRLEGEMAAARKNAEELGDAFDNTFKIGKLAADPARDSYEAFRDAVQGGKATVTDWGFELEKGAKAAGKQAGAVKEAKSAVADYIEQIEKAREKNSEMKRLFELQGGAFSALPARGGDARVTGNQDGGLAALTSQNIPQMASAVVTAMTPAQVAMKALQDGTMAFGEVWRSVSEQVAASGSLVQGAVMSASNSMLQYAEQGGQSMKELAKVALSSAAKIVRAHIMEGVSRAVASALQSVPFPLNIAAGAVAGAAAGVLFNKLISKISVPALAEGGLASGPTMAMVGEYPGARGNPEVIAPLSKLEGMLARGSQTVNVVGVIRGSDILLMSEKAAADRQRVRGG